MKTAIAILARAPVAGEAKTRLIARLGAAGAAQLQARLIDAALAKAVALAPAHCTLWVAGELAHPAVVESARRHGVAVRGQVGDDLGARMHHAAAATLAQTVDACLIIGTDCPALTTAHLAEASAALARHDVVVIPALDGGYVLIGLQQAQPAIFTGIDWGTEHVLRQTRARLAAAVLTHFELPALPDLDTPEDYDTAVTHGWIAA